MSFQYPWFLALIPVLLWLFRWKQTRTSVTVEAITAATNLELGRAATSGLLDAYESYQSLQFLSRWQALERLLPLIKR